MLADSSSPQSPAANVTPPHQQKVLNRLNYQQQVRLVRWNVTIRRFTFQLLPPLYKRFSLDSLPDMWRKSKGKLSPTGHFTLLMVGKRSDLEWNASDFCRFVTHGNNVLTLGDQMSTKYEFFIWMQIVVHKSVHRSINCPTFSLTPPSPRRFSQIAPEVFPSQKWEKQTC